VTPRFVWAERSSRRDGLGRGWKVFARATISEVEGRQQAKGSVAEHLAAIDPSPTCRSRSALRAQSCFRKQTHAYDGWVAVAVPLDEGEDLFWRSLMKLVITLPRSLGQELERTAGITETEFSVLTELSEAPGRQLKMSELAVRTALSASRISRVVDVMGRRGLVTREPSTRDRRMLFATLPAAGVRARQRAVPEHLRCVRRTLFDTMVDREVESVGAVLDRLTEAMTITYPSSGGVIGDETLRRRSRTRRAGKPSRGV
jgi:DNA-binding MarR family transcriptional regulator